MSTPAPRPNRCSQAEYAERDGAVLRYIWRNRVGLNAVLSARFFDGKQAGHVLRRFAAKGWLRLESGKIPGGISVAVLTASGGRQIGREVRPKALGAVGLDLAIATSFFAAIDAPKGIRRFRLLPSELHDLCKGFVQNVPHVWTDEGGEPAVLRVQLAASGTPREVRRKTHELVQKLHGDRDVASWLNSGHYGLALLGHTRERVRQLTDAVSRDKRFEGVRIVVGLGPTVETLAKVLRAGRMPR